MLCSCDWLPGISVAMFPCPHAYLCLYQPSGSLNLPKRRFVTAACHTSTRFPSSPSTCIPVSMCPCHHVSIEAASRKQAPTQPCTPSNGSPCFPASGSPGIPVCMQPCYCSQRGSTSVAAFAAPAPAALSPRIHVALCPCIQGLSPQARNARACYLFPCFLACPSPCCQRPRSLDSPIFPAFLSSFRPGALWTSLGPLTFLHVPGLTGIHGHRCPQGQWLPRNALRVYHLDMPTRYPGYLLPCLPANLSTCVFVLSTLPVATIPDSS
jgi:hypothetical protein